MGNNIKSFRFPPGIENDLGRFAEEPDYAEHIEQLIKQVLLTNPGDRINRPDFGCGLKRMVFAPNSEVTVNLTQILIIQALEKWLGSVIKTNEVKVTSVDEKLEVHISYTINALMNQRYLNLEVTL
jgi:phage baseplate assembly protein W